MVQPLSVQVDDLFHVRVSAMGDSRKRYAGIISVIIGCLAKPAGNNVCLTRPGKEKRCCTPPW